MAYLKVVDMVRSMHARAHTHMRPHPPARSLSQGVQPDPMQARRIWSVTGQQKGGMVEAVQYVHGSGGHTVAIAICSKVKVCNMGAA